MDSSTNPNQDRQAADAASQSSMATQNERTIPVSQPQKELLNSNEVVEEFLGKLHAQNIFIESSTLHTDRIVITQGDPTLARQCLESVVCSATVSFSSGDDSESKLTDLCRRFHTQFAVKVSDSDRVEIAFLPCIKNEVMPVLEDLKWGKKLIPLPGYLIEFFQHRLQNFKAKLNSNFHFPVDLSIVTGPQNQPELQLKCDRTRLSEAVSVLENRLTLLCYRRLEVSHSLGGFLQSSAGRELVQGIENSQHCTMHVKTHDVRVLLEARSPRGHQVKVCEGNLAMTECPVIVLPLCDGLEEWPPAYECILQRGCLISNASHYLGRVGMPPKPLTLLLNCQELASRQTVVVMYVPQRSHAQFQEMLSAAVKEAVNLAGNARSGLALPLKLYADIDFNTICCILRAVCDCYDNNTMPPMIQFYLDHDAAMLVAIVSFFQTKEWTVSTVTDPVEAIFDQRVKVMIGDIMLAEGDAVVNSTDPNLCHDRGELSMIFLDAVGGELTQQCQQRYAKGIGEHTVAVTNAFSLRQFNCFFHVALPVVVWDNVKTKKEETQGLLRALRSRVEACLCLASIKGFSSIVFPALATGKLQYPPEIEASTVLETTKEFFKNMPHSSLRKITFVAYKKNRAVAKEFKAEEAVYRYSLDRFTDRGKVDRRFSVKDVLVQVIKGDAMTRRCTAEILVCANPPAQGSMQGYSMHIDAESSLAIVNQRNVKNDVRDLLKTTPAASVQINLQSFDTDQVDNVIKGIEKANALHVQIITIVVASSDKFLKICSILARSYSSAAKVNSAGSNDKTLPCVGICGSMKDTRNAVQKVLETKVPERYLQAERYNLHTGFLEPAACSSGPVPMGNEALQPPVAAGAPPEQQVEGPAEFSVPTHQLRGVDILKLVQEFSRHGISTSFSGSSAKFRMRQGGATQLHACVQQTLAGLFSPTSQQGAQALLVAPQMSDSAVIQSVDSLNIPAEYQAQQRTFSREFDKVVSLEGTGSGGSRQDDPHRLVDDGSSFSFVDGHGDAGHRSGTMAQGPADLLTEVSGIRAASAASSDDESAVMAAAKSEALDFLKQYCAEPGSLRQEELQLMPRELEKLGSAVDCQSEGITAYVKVLPNLKKVVVFALDYDSINRAMHLVKVKSGKIVVRTRSRGRADERAAPRSSARVTQSMIPGITERQQAETSFTTHSSRPDVQQATAGGQKINAKNFVTKNGLEVSVQSGDITAMWVDAIVNAAHERLIHGGGVAAAISRAAGSDLREEGDKYVSENGPLKVTEVAVTTAGALPCQKVLHAVGPRWADYSDKTLCGQHLSDTILNCLVVADSLGLLSIAFTSVSAGIFGVPEQVCAESYLQAVLTFDYTRGNDTKLRKINFVDICDNMVGTIQNVFDAHWRNA
ncbi:uncharacterized protein LOC143293609 isoform X2 [Babylonia areolata]|uniref:uncharacterized protein LOC143293609 isoform X2 n=1 Tax=Babylonia areolata TaxID=304850 RepID=UPI003FD05AF9